MMANPFLEPTTNPPYAAPDNEKPRKTDGSVRLGPLKGPTNGEVPMEVTMGKPRAYYPPKKGIVP